jgi:arginase
MSIHHGRVRRLSVIGVPSDLGQGRRGVDMGPSAIRYAGLADKLRQLQHTVHDCGNVDVPQPETREHGEGKLKYLAQVRQVCEALAATVREAMERGDTPIVLGGDHSVSIGSITGVTSVRRPVGCIWFDAHGDMNTADTTPSGNIHGMPLAVSLGLGEGQLTSLGGFAPKLRPESVVLVGARSIDAGEQRLIRETGIHVFTMADVDELGMGEVMRRAIEITTRGTDGVHLSVDLDGLDPMYAPGVGTPVNGGFTYREGHLAMELLAQAECVVSVDFVEVNPILDSQNRTGAMAVELAASLFGMTVL